ncbi:MAG: hypothetical protein LBR93_03465 [Treponema sp.]|jgi:hypothetical protein|nr:hypothetical protein [Treponema sp.]
MVEKDNILKGFLERNGSEVVNMLFGEWKLEDALVVEREEGREERVTFIIHFSILKQLSDKG